MIDFGIIAAGDGNRIKEEGAQVPKPLVEIEGQPMIGRLISLMEKCGANSVNIIVNSDMPEVVTFLENLVPRAACELRYVTAKTPSSMHTFYHLVNMMKPADKFVVTTVDTIFRRTDFFRYVEAFKNLAPELDGLMGVTTFIDDEKPLYVCTDGHDIIEAFNDTPSGEAKYVSAGIYGLRTSAIPVLQSCIDAGLNRMRNFQRKLVETGLALKAFDLGKVLDVDHLADIDKANAFLV